MINPENPSSTDEDFVEMNRQIDKALRQCGRDVLIRHKRDGFPIVGWDGERVVITAPEDIVIPPAED